MRRLFRKSRLDREDWGAASPYPERPFDVKAALERVKLDDYIFSTNHVQDYLYIKLPIPMWKTRSYDDQEPQPDDMYYLLGEGAVYQGLPIPWDIINTESDLFRFCAYGASCLQAHELQEQIKVDGKYLLSPHHEPSIIRCSFMREGDVLCFSTGDYDVSPVQDA
jgi:hypothetical protein